MDRMETPERAHLRESLPAGRLAVLRARKMVLPVGREISRIEGEGKESKHTRLHTHEDTPSAVGCGVHESDKEATDEEDPRSMMDIDFLDKILAKTGPGKSMLVT